MCVVVGGCAIEHLALLAGFSGILLPAFFSAVEAKQRAHKEFIAHLSRHHASGVHSGFYPQQCPIVARFGRPYAVGGSIGWWLDGERRSASLTPPGAENPQTPTPVYGYPFSTLDAVTLRAGPTAGARTKRTQANVRALKASGTHYRRGFATISPVGERTTVLS